MPKDHASVRVRYTRAGGHVHVRVFSVLHDQRDKPGTLGKAGDLCFTAEEWALFLQVFQERTAVLNEVLGVSLEVIDETPDQIPEPQRHTDNDPKLTCD